MINDANKHLTAYSSQADEDIDLGDLALVMAQFNHENKSVDRYVQHIKKIKSQVAERYDELISNGADVDAGSALAALKHVLSDIYDYRADDKDHEILESADIMRLIDRGLGCRAAIAALYMIAARSQGWLIEGLNFPDIFLCRIEAGGQRLIFDPAGQCRVLEAHDLRSLIKDALGDGAELSNSYFDGLGARATVIHLSNYIKTRYIEMGDYASALEMVERMMVIAPDEYRLLLDAGVLYARSGQVDKAIDCLNSYISAAPEGANLYDAQMLLDELLV